MKSFLKKNKVAFIILLVALLLFIFFFTKAWPNRQLQRYLAVGMGVFYFFWGVFTHIRSKKINSEVIFEYLAIAILATLIITLITF
jgi:hypothetical protein